MTVPTSIDDLQAQESLNYPKGTDNVGGTIDDYFRAHASIIKLNFGTGGTVSSAATLAITADGKYFEVTGTATIQGLPEGQLYRSRGFP